MREVGRIAYVDDRGPMVVPVTYVVNDASLLVRVAPYSQLARHLPDAQAALEVDDIDYFTRSGWSVVVRGRIEAIDSDELPTLEPRPTPWAEGQRTLYLRLTPTSSRADASSRPDGLAPWLGTSVPAPRAPGACRSDRLPMEWEETQPPKEQS